MHGDILPRLPDPRLGVGCARKAHGLGQRRIDLAVLERREGSKVARVWLSRGAIRAADLDQRPELSLELRPGPFLRRARAQLRTQIAVLVDEIVQAHGRM